jgi:hypothetical protein
MIRTSRRSYLPVIELGTTTKIQKKSMNSPDETRSFDKGKAEITTLANGITIGRAYLEPGWRNV